jgi:hypothetical protein
MCNFVELVKLLNSTKVMSATAAGTAVPIRNEMKRRAKRMQ